MNENKAKTNHRFIHSIVKELKKKIPFNSSVCQKSHGQCGGFVFLISFLDESFVDICFFFISMERMETKFFDWTTIPSIMCMIVNDHVAIAMQCKLINWQTRHIIEVGMWFRFIAQNERKKKTQN